MTMREHALFLGMEASERQSVLPPSWPRTTRIKHAHRRLCRAGFVSDHPEVVRAVFRHGSELAEQERCSVF